MGPRGRAFAALRAAASLVLLGSLATAAACGGGDGGGDPGPAAGEAGGAPVAPAAPGPSPDAPSAPPPAPRPAVRVAFKLDAVLTRGVYMGERWVAPPVFEAAAQAADVFRQEARIERAPAGAVADATWNASDAGAVAVSPTAGREVAISVSHPGRSTLTVAVGADSTVLTVDAVLADGRWLVTFSE
jgi:hypothetical protein